MMEKFNEIFLKRLKKETNATETVTALFLSRFIYRKAAWLAIRIVYTATSISSIDSCENFPQTTVCYRNIARAINIEHHRNALLSSVTTYWPKKCFKIQLCTIIRGIATRQNKNSWKTNFVYETKLRVYIIRSRTFLTYKFRVHSRTTSTICILQYRC